MKVKIGKRFGKLKVLSLSRIEKYASGQNKYIWLCQCDCGNTCEKHNKQLLENQFLNCGCQKPRATHNMRNTRLYNIWSGMKTRCYAKSCKNKAYQKNHIKICDEWRNSFIAFYNWALKNGYQDDLSIDRIDVYGDYEPLNCRWADRITQENNTTKNVWVLIKGEVHTIAEWSRILNISPARIKRRVDNGWYCKLTRTEALKRAIIDF
jgi:hypothetical protein